MPSPIQEVMTRPSAAEPTEPSTATTALTPHGKITAYFTRRALKAGLGGGLALAIAASLLFHAGVGDHGYAMIGVGLVVWAVATLAIVLVMGVTTYVSVRRRIG